MRTISITIISIAIAVVGIYGLVQANVFSPTCAHPIRYQVGSIDSEFQISSSTVRELLADAAAVWEERTSKNLFTHAPDNANLTVDFVYDERQRRTRAKDELENSLSSLAKTHDGLTDNIASKRDQYEAVRTDYESARGRYETSLNQFNEKVNRWNRRDEIPESVRQELAAERDRLDSVRKSLTQTRDRLLQLQDEINRLAERSNSIAQNYNQTADTFEDRFGTSSEFSQATYADETITVYQYNQASDLRLALTHEFGHALGIEHVNEPQAIMHRLMKNQSLANISLTAADRRALANTCGW